MCIDDIDCIYGDKEWEYSLFILLNRILDSSKKIIFTSTTSLVLDKIKLMDLKSRISWGLIFMINKPSDSTKEKILKKVLVNLIYKVNLLIYL